MQKRIFHIFLVVTMVFLSSRPAWAESWNFAVFGDTRSSSSNPGVNTTALSTIASDIVDKRDCAFVLIVGDLVYGGNPESQYELFKTTVEDAGFKLGGSDGTGVPYYPVRGNHEVSGDSDAAVWRTKFDTVPQNGPTGEAGLTYSFTYENALVLAVDEYIGTDHTINNQTWVDQQLAASDAQHVFAFGHDPAYRASHSDCLADYVSNRDAFLTSLYNAGGRLYFCGHDHMTALARVYEKDLNDGGTQGFYQVLVGGGGAPKTNFNGVYNSGSHSGDHSVKSLYHDSDTGSSIPFHYAYAVVTIDDDLLWLRVYGTESLDPTDWEYLYTLVISGTLETDTSILTSDMNNDANVVFNQTSDGTYAGVISGLGNITKNGQAMLTFAGDNTYTGSTTVSEGTLKVTGDLSDSAVTVNSSGILMGTGPIKSLTNSGIVRPGNSVGTLDLSGGAFSQDASGTLEIEVESEISYDQIINVSTASLSGTLKTITTGTYDVGDTLTDVIETTGGINGSFSSLCTQITPTIVWKPNTNGNSLDLVATREYNNTPLETVLTPNQQNVAALMQGALPTATGDLAAVKTVIDNLTTNAQVAAAYAEISPEKLNVMPEVAMNNTAMEVDMLQQETQALRTGAATNTYYNSYTGDFSGDLLRGVLIAYEEDDWGKFIPASLATEHKAAELGFFIKGNGSFGDKDATENQPGFSFNAGGITGGIDYRFKENLILGLYSGYIYSASKLESSGGKVEADSLSYGGFGTYHRNDFYLDASCGMTSNFYDTERNIVFAGINRKAKADTSGRQLNVLLKGGYDFHLEKVVTGPIANMRYSKLWIDDFTETGAGALNMHIDDQTAESLQLGAGWQAYSEVKVGGGILRPSIHASYQREFYDDRRTVEAKLAQGGNAFQVSSDGADEGFIVVGCGLELFLKKDISAGAHYQTHVGQDNYSVHNISLTVHSAF